MYGEKGSKKGWLFSVLLSLGNIERGPYVVTSLKLSKYFVR